MSTYARYNSFLLVRIYITLSRLRVCMCVLCVHACTCVFCFRACIHMCVCVRVCIRAMSDFDQAVRGPMFRYAFHEDASRTTWARPSGFIIDSRHISRVCTRRKFELGHCSVLGGFFLSVSIRLDEYLWNTCGAPCPSILANSISGCTCTCALDRRPLCTSSR